MGGIGEWEGRMAYAEQVNAFEALAWDDGHELHFGEEGHLGVGQARRERERHFDLVVSRLAGMLSRHVHRFVLVVCRMRDAR